jgi:EAL domain-containing protein (putative c-di-GMP-specific phosphodiesterase class I)
MADPKSRREEMGSQIRPTTKQMVEVLRESGELSATAGTTRSRAVAFASIAPADDESQVFAGSGIPPSSHQSGAVPSGTLSQSELVRELLVERAVDVAFQPIYDMRRRRIFAYEALARPPKTHFGGNPATMFQAAAEAKLAGQLGRLVRAKASHYAPNTALFFNVHPSEFDAPYIVRPDDPVFAHTDAVFLEVTEQVPLSAYVMCRPLLKELANRGVNLVVDDLGAGYSNLKYIADLEPKVVKIDRELIIGLTVGTRLFKLVTKIVDMCQALGAEVVVEGIETREEYLAVLETGAHYAQGYFLARPLIGALPVLSMELREAASQATYHQPSTAHAGQAALTGRESSTRLPPHK